ncbi:hypothetical protein CMV_006576 [Castanea mollissima]|uniref:Uncharacterized protein n=1 Tax=Castanea mollissima TaxID=60419 RepID=A0A8J4W3H0_9ROSI|nr:hypothetical protein CMV_006576 [Castanea mollissima]
MSSGSGPSLLLSNDFNSLLDDAVDIYSDHTDCTRSCNCSEDRSHSLTYKLEEQFIIIASRRTRRKLEWGQL